MRNYELVVIVHPDLDENAVNAVVEKVKGWIVEAGGVVAKVDMWGRRRMAYAILKQHEGQYVMFQFEIAPSFCSELERNLRFFEPVMRFLLVSAN